MASRITIQYFPGRPHRRLADERLHRALDRLGGPRPAIELCEVRDEAEARRVDFHGSPTVLIDGVDPFADWNAPIGVACRVYATPAGLDGALSVEQLCAMLR